MTLAPTAPVPAALLLSLLLSGAALAHTCPVYPSADLAIDKWETTRTIAVAPTVREAVLADYCTAGKRLTEDRGVSSAAIDSASERIVARYLDRAADPQRAGQSMAAVMRTEFNAGSLSPADIKRYGRLAIIYTRDVDALRVKGQRFRRVVMLLVEVGKAKVEGLKADKVLCAAQVDIDSSVEATFKC